MREDRGPRLVLMTTDFWGPDLSEKPKKIFTVNTPKYGVLIFAYMSGFFGKLTPKIRQKAAKTRHFMAWSNEPRCAIILGVRRKTSRKTKYPKPDAYGGGCSQDSQVSAQRAGQERSR